ncbi:MAG: HAMP domain-containing sensor histidine kinase [Candidatus Phosphoribacter sp.]
MTPEASAVLLASGSAAATGAFGALGVWGLARRSIPAALVAAPLVVNLSVAAGVLVSARAMFISEHDVSLVLLVVAAAVPVALGYGLLLARRLHRLDRAAADRAAEAVATRERDAQVEAHRRDLVAWASHDLRTPLAGIRAMAEAMEDGVEPAGGSYPARIRAEADRMAAMVEDLLALSRIHSGALTLRYERVSVADLVSDALATGRPLAERRGVVLDGRADGTVLARLDAREIGRVLDNLIGNAIAASPAGGHVSVTARCEDGDAVDGGAGLGGTVAVVRVSDSCGGIPEAVRERMFQPWWRGDSARSPGPGEGSGLGLAVVRGLVEAHGGRVGIVNADGGCVVEVRLPQG